MGLLYGVLFQKGHKELAREVWHLMGSSKATTLAELSKMEMGAEAGAMRWIATAKLAIQGDKDRFWNLEVELLRELGLPEMPE